MSGTIAQLGIEVDSGDAVQAATDLERLTQAGIKAEKAAEGVAAGFDKAATASTGLATAEGKLSESTEDAMKRLTAMAKASLDSSDYYQRLTTSVATNSSALDNSSSSVSSLAALQRRLQAESDALVGSTDRQAEAAKKAAAATGVQAEGLQALLAKINPAIAALDKLDQQQAQLQKYKAAGLIDAETFRDYSTRIDASRQKLGDFDEGLRKTGVSSAQTQAALRQLPAQFSDIFTSLAGGQNPLMVLIQQGGQIKDSFGGVGNTFDVLKDKFRSLFSGGAGAAVLGESLAGIATNAKDAAENTGKAGEGLSSLAEGTNTAAEAAENAKKAYGALPPSVTGASMSVVGMTVAVLAAAAAIGILIYGYSQGSKEAQEYNKALILTGNYAGTSADQMANLAQQVSATNGTTGEAAASLTKLAASGVIAGDSFKEIADAAAAMEDATGKSVDATIAEFVKIAKDPVAAAKELNDQYNFLTASTYAQIVALKEQGDTIGAADLLTKAYADTVQNRSKQVTDNLGLWQKAWKGVKDAASGALDGLNNVGRAKTYSEQIEDLKAKLTGSNAYDVGGLRMNPGAVSDKEREDIKGQIRFLELQEDAEKSLNKYLGDRTQTQKEGISAEQRLKQISDSNLSNAEKRDKLSKAYLRDVETLRKANPDDPKVQADYVAKTLQNIKDKNKDPKAASSAGAVDLTSVNATQNALKAIQAEYANTEKQLDAAQKAGLISQDAYATQRSVLIKAEKDEVTSAYEAEIAALEEAKGKATTTGEQRIQLDQKIADARADMVKAQKSADSELEVLATNEQGRLKKQELAVQTYTSALQQQVDTLRQQGQRAAAGLGQGDRQRGLTDQQNAIDDRINSQKLDLANQYGDGSRGMSLDEYTKKLAALKTTQQDLHDTVQSNYDEMTDAQGSWSAGASSAWQNYLESARDVAGQTKSLFTNAFSSMEDAIVNFAMTGKLSFADFAKSILADMARIATRQASSSALSAIFGLAASAGASYFGGGTGSAGSTQAGYTGTDLSGFTPGSVQANGGAWSGGVQMFADGGAFSNSVVSKPTAFGMAGGQTGVMGEAGPEAIMPLTRTAGGALGVRALGGGSGGGTVITVQVNVASDGSTSSTTDDPAYQQFGKDLADFVDQRYQKLVSVDLRQGGKINRAIKG
ncbi:phage tail tape measure protein [Pseudomonas sp. ADAK2]|uniref:phage tail tape measure protein n=1 Tax=unclassified Pseudomonas TaxID=196821 RepID=UPI0014648299|nr:MULTISPECIES: phage tail tape measure protein [unclassified Pseudomonas]QJI40470.1 phage tail tape measure protein [Pseudomonas sp. ADAK7]QJI46775.1 phage tail tape measure protein [Pseudomonas sp. ADAK2]